MPAYAQWTAFYTMLRKDMVRIFRIWVQTFIPSVITSALYFLIFGTVLGSRIGQMQGVDYMSFVVPGLVMLAIVTNAYANSSFTFFQSKFFARSIDEMLVSPMPPWLIIAGFVAGGVIRGVLVGALVLMISVFFTGLHLSIFNLAIILVFAILTAIVFALAGLVNGVYAKSIDAINIVPTFVLTPLVYLGGVFYSIHSLPVAAQYVTYVNPIFYLINGFRYGFLGIADIALWISFAVLAVMIAALIAINMYLIRKGLGLKQ
ncbi:ABC transporter permease [Candidatus Kaiserbacteria bacterium RIFCSPHIGHO2_02_FULL_55_25]|uniref:Transport permease protein n=2 Tax=Parcubacteria group TaxID=1794811 RepID=A0A1F4Y0P1_9BACT|nr:MAG: ABC transporter permease [Candidatus Adlerbacteria bacterium RIFCSPLOWO2_01_FULL_54_16]OGG53107.1 MAG: ABC transporter permease [Candidatus Kaiserbacteria bacterium RIFCSPHIGHO2_01_FULL_55_79]OGG68889.1 MAG: ABC transporter permease [Candidatus Kaiserbacteria bacterium RIFCSPHIGHO2_02_FULL_55_25]OGG77431.1 MAG: ABC transporter permease [Candidatus Kaiserbacteria bacterium RIFCSPHIGHO2_12_FULL_55_13]